MASFSVVSNIASANAQASLQTSNLALNKSLQRLSSGLRINSSGDDAAGLAVANAHRSQQAILTQGIRNANDGLSDLQIKDGALNNISTLLDRLATSQLVNKKAAESRIRDANIAEESANLTRFNILSQSGIAALAQANATSASVLAHLR